MPAAAASRRPFHIEGSRSIPGTRALVPASERN